MADYAEVFLAEFGGPLPELSTKPWKNTSFTFAAARLQPRDELLAGVDDLDQEEVFARANGAALKIATEGLSLVKKNVKENASLDEALLAGLLNDSGMTIQIDPATIAHGCVRGRLVDVIRR